MAGARRLAGCSWTPGALCVFLPSLSWLLVDSWCSVCLSAISQPAAHGLLVLCVSLCHLPAGCSWTPGALCVSLPSLSQLLVDTWCSVRLPAISQLADRGLLAVSVSLCHLSVGCSWTPGALCVSLPSLSRLLADSFCSVCLSAISQPAARGLLVLCVSLCHLSAGCSLTPGALCVSLPSLSRLLTDSWCYVCLSAISQPAARGLLVLCVSPCHLSVCCSRTPGALCVPLPPILSQLLMDSGCFVCLSAISQLAARGLLVLFVSLCHLSAGCSWTPGALCVFLPSLSRLHVDSWCSVCLSDISQPAARELLVLCVSL
ncbi:hypothetical protein NDU88_008649 [Pleurodeles waltl]|uniref:Uncharacterized protein n=1 Tax=Pleurodeles waltl TaxID=8319 RepID=A0AAV7NDQ0_PLEWA|nr:hypothetical protein NDU88_008649 [Pleurodeles waltl]